MRVLVIVTDDELDVSLDAWMVGDHQALRRMKVSDAPGKIVLAERAHRRGLLREARALFRAARRQNPRVLLRGDSRVLAERTRECLRAEVSDLMQWDATQLRVSFSRHPSLRIRTPWGVWRAWWTEEDALAEALRAAWRQTMEESIEEARWTNTRVNRGGVDAHAKECVDRLHAGSGVGELLGSSGPLHVTVSGFALVPVI